MVRWSPVEFGLLAEPLELISVEWLGSVLLNDMSVDIGTVEQMCTCWSSLVATQLVDDDGVTGCSSSTWTMFTTGPANDALHWNDDWATVVVFKDGCMIAAKDNDETT